MKKTLAFIIVTALLLFLIPGMIFLYYQRHPAEPVYRINTVEVSNLLTDLSNLEGGLEAVKEDPGLIDAPRSFDFTVLDKDEKVLFTNRKGDAESIVGATGGRDTVRNIKGSDNEIKGYLIIHNDWQELERKVSDRYMRYYLIGSGVTLLLILIFGLRTYVRIIRPFEKMKDFAASVSTGDLDTPLAMDRKNVFGAFTESFDIMREELKTARKKEYEANVSKRELVAQLSHDIKTPVASIKAMSEVLSARLPEESDRQKADSIAVKADQIDALVSNLFASALNDLEKMSVDLKEAGSNELTGIIKDADYENKVKPYEISECIILIDQLRTRQVVNNIIYNSYKYAGTPIYVESSIEDESLIVSFTDRGGGVDENEITLIVGEYKRGSNTKGKQGSGMGLYISSELMKAMGGSLEASNVDGGLRITLSFKLA